MPGRLFLIFFLSFLGGVEINAFVPGLLDQGRLMVTQIEKARRCSVEYNRLSKKMTFCSGLVLEKDDLKFLKELTFKGCRDFLKQRGYQVFEVESQKDIPPQVSNDVYQDFFQSTKLAWMLHKEKQILFKKGAKRGDCLHEILHFYQRERKSKSALAPLKRKDIEAKLQALLEKAVIEVENTEKKGDKEKAKKMASQLQPFIALQREWQKMINWLDEKEIYQAFFDYHGHFFEEENKKEGEKRNWDIALANLVRLKDSLAWDLRERVLSQAQVALNQKYQSVATPRTLRGLKSEEEYGALYNKGQISREDFESKVIGLRKYQASQEVAKARRKGDLFETLKARAKLRNFGKKKDLKATVGKEFTYMYLKELPMLLVQGQPFILDTGANESILPPVFLKGLKEQDVVLLGSKVLQTVVGQTEAAPIIQLLRPLKIGEQQIEGLTFVVSKLPMPGISGILGIDFFKALNDGRWSWDPLKRKIYALDKGPVGPYRRPLLTNGKGEIDALEFRCNEVKVRLDSGSQVIGDIPLSAKDKKYHKCEKELLGTTTVHEKLLKAPVGSALFSREVDINFGYPFIKNLELMTFDLKKREISFKVRKGLWQR